MNKNTDSTKNNMIYGEAAVGTSKAVANKDVIFLDTLLSDMNKNSLEVNAAIRGLIDNMEKNVRMV